MGRRLEQGFNEKECLLGVVGVEACASPSPGFVGEGFGDVDVGVDVAEELSDMAGFEAFEGCAESVADGEPPERGADAIGDERVRRQQGGLQGRWAGTGFPAR